MQVEEFTDLARHRALQPGAQRMHLLARRIHGVVQAFEFLVNRRGRHALFGDLQHMRQAQLGAAQRDAARGAVAVQAQA